ncbi:UNVERIFIED_ORG: hypothetical protein M2438_002800 [Methylobacterium sp. SuP10 SLI 274]|nr:hypothetical protein [Methylorubrum extorquens]MDF9864032.1 hypothetical protein [Methylorubrum pseudosasae]MDH6637625.1 hypothetical protein [Methylobacterium sp. SuP10 SLI 274]MDH6666805.1 hypothetical protein [Methylorubrum zatmanii]
MRAEREDWFEAQDELGLNRLVFVDETATTTNMMRRLASAAGSQFRTGMCGRPFGCKQNLRMGAARDRVLPCVRLLMRRVTCRGPVWECEGQDHITGTRSKRSPQGWFSRPHLTGVAPYLSVDLLTRSDILAPAPAYAVTAGAR